MAGRWQHYRRMQDMRLQFEKWVEVSMGEDVVLAVLLVSHRKKCLLSWQLFVEFGLRCQH